MARQEPLLTPEASRLLVHLRDESARTRSELAELSGLARSTVAARLDSLIETGLVAVSSGGVSSGGRPPGFVAFQPAARILLAIDLGATHGLVAFTDLSGTVLDLESTSLDIADGPETILRWALDAAERLRARLDRPASDIVGVGIGLPGPVEHSTGMPTNPPIMPAGIASMFPPTFGRRSMFPCWSTMT